MDSNRLLPAPPQPPNLPYHEFDYRGMDNGLWWLHGLFSLLIVLALIAGTVYLLRMFLRRPMPRWGAPARNPAMEELDLRYARGEVDRADYLQRRIDLIDRSTGSHPATPPSAPPAAGP